MQRAPVLAERQPGPRPLTRLLNLLTCFFLLIPAAGLLPPLWAISARQASPQKSKEQKKKLPKPQQLDMDVTWQRDPTTGELYSSSTAGKGDDNSTATRSPAPAIRVTSQIVPV